MCQSKSVDDIKEALSIYLYEFQLLQCSMKVYDSLKNPKIIFLDIIIEKLIDLLGDEKDTENLIMKIISYLESYKSTGRSTLDKIEKYKEHISKIRITVEHLKKLRLRPNNNIENKYLDNKYDFKTLNEKLILADIEDLLVINIDLLTSAYREIYHSYPNLTEIRKEMKEKDILLLRRKDIQ